MGRVLKGEPVIPGALRGLALVSTEPLSFWGGYDQATGEIIDRRHPLAGEQAAGRILGLPASRGSSTTTAVLLESIRAGTAPAALLTRGVDTFFALACVVAEELYDHALPLVALSPHDYDQLRSGQVLRLGLDGEVEILEEGP